MKDHGKVHLVNIINTICELLKTIADIGAIYGNLRIENIIIKLNHTATKILSVKFLGFGSIIKIEDSDQILVPARIDHLPPDMTSHLVNIKRFAVNDFASSQISNTT